MFLGLTYIEVSAENFKNLKARVLVMVLYCCQYFQENGN